MLATASNLLDLAQNNGSQTCPLFGGSTVIAGAIIVRGSGRKKHL